MNTLNDTIYELEERLADLSTEVGKLRKRLVAAKDLWPDHQVKTADMEWHTRDDVPPEGLIWASDGIMVWTIYGRGEPIDEGASSVLYWTKAFIPAPPIDQ